MLRHISFFQTLNVLVYINKCFLQSNQSNFICYFIIKCNTRHYQLPSSIQKAIPINKRENRYVLYPAQSDLSIYNRGINPQCSGLHTKVIVNPLYLQNLRKFRNMIHHIKKANHFKQTSRTETQCENHNYYPQLIPEPLIFISNACDKISYCSACCQ